MKQNLKGKGSKSDSLQAFVVRNVVAFAWAVLVLSALGLITVDINEVVFVFVSEGLRWGLAR
jgi:hypothetical protein